MIVPSRNKASGGSLKIGMIAVVREPPAARRDFGQAALARLNFGIMLPLMGYQSGDRNFTQNGSANTAKNHFPQGGAAISAHDEQVASLARELGEEDVSGALIPSERNLELCRDSVPGKSRNQFRARGFRKGPFILIFD